MLISCNFIGQLVYGKFWMSHSFYKGYVEGVTFRKKMLNTWKKDARTVVITEKHMAVIVAT